MKLADALIAYNPGTDQVRVGPLLSDFDRDWTMSPIQYGMTCGAANVGVRRLSGIKAGHYIMSEFIGLVARDGVDATAAHREFCKIDEYRKAIPADATCDHTRGFRLPPPGPGEVSRVLRTMRNIQSINRPGLSDVAVVLQAIGAVVGCQTDCVTARYRDGKYLTVEVLDDDYDGVPDFDALAARLLLDLAISTGRTVVLGAPVVSEGDGIIGVELQADRNGALVLALAVL